MSTPRPVVFYRTTLLEVSDEMLVMKIPGGWFSTWFFFTGIVLACAAPAVLLYLEARGAPDLWLIVTLVLGGIIVMMPWNVVERVALAWSRLAPARGHVALRRADDGTYALTINGRVEARSRRRGLFFLDEQGVNVLVLVIGDRATTIATYVQTGSSGMNWSFSQFDQGRVELAHGANPFTDTWPARSVVPLVRAVSQVLQLGPQPAIAADGGLGIKATLATIFWILGLPVFHLIALTWLKANPHVGEAVPLLSRGFLLGVLLVLPDVWILSRHLKRSWLDPFNRKADEMVNHARAASRD